MTTLVGLRLNGRLVVLVGGGCVAARRLKRFLAEGATVRLITPRLAPEAEALVERFGVEWVPRVVREEDLAEAWLVHTATGDPAADARVATWCEEAKIFCVNASDGNRGSARMAAVARSGDVLVGVVSDLGIDPRRSARLRDALAEIMREQPA